MKSGIIGMAGSGKSTVFDALTGAQGDPSLKGENRIGTMQVPDHRIGALSNLYQPKKTIFAQVEYFLPAIRDLRKDSAREQNVWSRIRDCDALIHVLRNFGGYGYEPPNPLADFKKIDQELILADLMVVEKRIERLDLDQKRGKNIDLEEQTLLNNCLASLENEVPLRKDKSLAMAPPLRGFALLSAKPMLLLFNNEDEDEHLPDIPELTNEEECNIIRGKLEQELTQMSAAEAIEFLQEFNIAASAMDRVIQQTYHLLGLISFFTVGEDEVRAWTIREGTLALDAAGVVHTDFKQGFIRAEVVGYDDLMAAGSLAEARKKGTVRLEGKTYEVRNGDVINFRFNV
jgi:GTP-binding protein YchF